MTWSGCWSFRRKPSRPWCGPPAPRLPVCPGPARPAGRRASVLWPGLSRAALLAGVAPGREECFPVGTRMSHNGRVAPAREELLVLVPAFAGTTAGELGIGPRGRRAAVLWPGLSRAALLVCPLHLGVGPINGDQADCVGRPPPGSTRRPGDHLILRLGEIDDDALVSLFDCQPKPPPVCAGLCQF